MNVEGDAYGWRGFGFGKGVRDIPRNAPSRQIPANQRSFNDTANTARVPASINGLQESMWQRMSDLLATRRDVELRLYTILQFRICVTQAHAHARTVLVRQRSQDRSCMKGKEKKEKEKKEKDSNPVDRVGYLANRK